MTMLRNPMPRLRLAEPVVMHLHPCDCPDCAPRPRPAREAAIWGLAGCAFGNVVAFVADPHGTWSALAAAAAQLIGAGR